MESHDHEPDGWRVSFPGPFQHHDVVVDGWRVPFLRVHLKGEDRVMVVLDRRMGVELSTGEAERVLPFIADAISVPLDTAPTLAGTCLAHLSGRRIQLLSALLKLRSPAVRSAAGSAGCSWSSNPAPW